MPHRQIPMTVDDDGRAATAAPVFADPRVRTFVALGELLIYRADLETGQIVWVPTLLEHWGYAAADIVATAEWWLGLTHPDDVGLVVGFLQEALVGQRTEWELRYRIKRADGTWAHVLGRARLLRDDAGVPVATEGVVSDVSPMVAAEDALREREQRYRLLAENSRELICRHDPDGTYRYVSPAATELSGWTPDEMLGRNPYDFFHPDDRERITEESHQLALRGELDRVGIVYRFLRRDGSYLWLETLTRPIVDASGAVVALQTSSRDVSERRALQERLSRAQRVEAIGTLAGGVAHDFNSLLTVIRANTELLWGDVRDAGARAVLAEVQDAVQQAAALTRQLMILGRQELSSHRVVDAAQVVRGLGPLVTRVVGTRIRATLEAWDGSWVTCDQAQLEQLVLNLVANARDAMPDGGTLRVTCQRVTLAEERQAGLGAVPPGEWVQLTVADDGVGMTPSVLERALEPFFTTKPVGQGTGLGLATVHTIVQRVQGHVTIDSSPQVGTTISCWLRPSPAVAVPAAHEPASRAPAARKTGDRPLVLVVDDESGVRGVAQRVLERHGYGVVTADDGSTALTLLEGGLQPAVVLTDVMMPVMTGRALAEAMRARGLRIPVVFMSGYAREELLADGMLGRELPLVQKPFTLTALVEAVRDAIGSHDDAVVQGG
jgi:two-component system, cell cycle sensor histidine kinase and response regulator CckA